jgi:Ca-activated chloride channel family protein
MLYLIWLVPLAAVLFWYGHRRRQRILKRFAKPTGLAAILPDLLPRRESRAALILLILLLTVAALAGPQYGYRWEEVERRGVDLIVALDCSRSMLAEDIKPTRLDRAKREVVDLLGMLAGDRVGLVAFAGTAFLQCPLTVDYQAFDLFLSHLEPDYLPVGGTDLAAALTVAAEGFDPETASDKAVILITDGGHTAPSDLSAAMDNVKAAQIKIFCIGVGGEGGVPVPAAQGGFKKDKSGKIVLSRLDEAGLKQIALATGGGYVRSVAGDMDLETVYRQQIRKELTARNLTTSRRQVWENRYQWALGPAVFLLVLEMLLPGRRRRSHRRSAVKLVLPIALLSGALLLSSLLPQPCWAADGRKAAQAYEQGDYETALKGFIDAQLNDPDNPEVLYNVGNAYYKNGNFDAAGQQYRDALDKLGAADQRPDLAARLHYNLGNARFRAGDYPRAVEHYEKALELTPDDTQAKENLAYVKEMMAKKPPPQKQAGNDEAQDSQKQEASPSGDQASQADRQGQDAPDQGDDRSAEASADKASPDEASPGAGQKPPPSGGQEPEARGQEERFGKEMAAPEADADQKQADKERANAAQAAGAQGTPQPAEGIDPQFAEQMLNRLEDQPGKALMPAYTGPAVENDW